MIVKNESHVIERTLAMLIDKLPVSYWVISDTGSHDGTQDVIRNFFSARNIPGELVEHEWRDFGWNRTKSLEAAYNKTDYLIIFDADDWIHGNLVLPNLPPIGTDGEAPVDMYHFKFGPGMTYKRPLLINNRLKWRFVGVLHEYLNGGRPGGNREKNLEGDYYVESGKTGDRSRDAKKYDKDAAVLEKGYKEEQDQGLRDRYAFYCAQSYMDGRRPDKSIEWYKRVLDSNNWSQEKYYACLMIAGQTTDQTEAIKYYNEAQKHDPERREHVKRLMEIYNNAGHHFLVNCIYHKMRNAPTCRTADKLFLAQWDYNHMIEWYNSVSAFYAHDYETGFECCYKILTGNLISDNLVGLTIRNLNFYQNVMDKQSPAQLMELFQCVNRRMNPEDTSQLETWKQLYPRIKKDLTSYVYLPKTRVRPKVQVMLSITSCKRYDLFEQTVNSILNQWTDMDRIGYWFCVDDNSSAKDRKLMQAKYPFFEYYFKGPSEKGHIASMNIIWNKLNQLRPTYWIHLEDDFLFFDKMDYVTKAIEGLTLMKSGNVKQVLFNRGYAETIDEYRIKSYKPYAMKENEQGNDVKDFCLHDYRPGESFPYPNCHYWPYYSFRPSVLDVEAILSVGNYDCVDKFFEIEYAKKWTEKGYKSAFFNKLTCLHIGRLTSERHSTTAGTNAYDLNGVDEFNGKIQADNKPYIKIINLDRRPDRRQQMAERMKNADVAEYEFHRAVDGKDLEPTEDIYKLFVGNDFGNRKGVIGCALTHYGLWKQLVDDKDHDFYFILEDDAELVPDFKTHLNKSLAAMKGKEIIMFGYHMFSAERETLTYVEGMAQLNLNRYIGGTFGYSINKEGALSLINYIEKNGIKHGIDYVIKIHRGDYYEYMPEIVKSDWNEGGKQIDSDIQNLYDGMDFDAFNKDCESVKTQFRFVSQLDQPDNDLFFYKSGSLLNMMRKALSDDTVKCFNTLGFYKGRAEESEFKPTQYFRSAKEGTYIKRGECSSGNDNGLIRVKMICNWCTSEQLCREWNTMTKGNFTWNKLKLVWEEPADYYVIINKPLFPDEHYVPERTIIFQMEPWCHGDKQQWGVKTWGEWARPDPARFLAVRTHETTYNNCMWQLDLTYTQLIADNFKAEKTQEDRIACICSSKYFDPGHIKRVDFLRFLETKDDVTVDIFMNNNTLGFKQPLPIPLTGGKEKGLVPYKYYFMCENNQEKNYITEKLWEPILTETLCFYWGCPNVEDWVDPRAYVKLDLDDFEAAYKTIKQAVEENWYEQRLPYIRQERLRVLNYYSFMPTLERILTQSK